MGTRLSVEGGTAVCTSRSSGVALGQLADAQQRAAPPPPMLRPARTMPAPPRSPARPAEPGRARPGGPQPAARRRALPVGVSALSSSPGARAYYDPHRAVGATHHAALRALGKPAGRHPARLSAPPPALRRGPRLAARCGPASRLTAMRPVGRQPGLDTDSPALCGYATEPRTRPDCGLTPVVAFGATRLCASCAAWRSTLGKGQRPRPLQAPAVDVLTWLAAAERDLR